MDNTRYLRQTILPEIGQQGQQKLSAASVLCIGSGGLGCPALLYMAAAGIGHIGIADFDTVDETNLQRQILFKTNQIRQNKALAAKKNLRELNPTIKITTHEEKITPQNSEEILSLYDIIIDGTDNFDTKFLLNDTCVKIQTPLISASILGFEGQISTFSSPHGPCYRCLFPSPPKHSVPNCAEAGIIGATAGLMGTTQAMEAIKLIIDRPDLKPLIGKLWTIDLRTMENKMLNLSKNPECSVCSLTPDQINLTTKLLSMNILTKEITPQDAIKVADTLLIDVREQEEWDAGHIESAIHFSLSKILQGYSPNLPKDKNIILYCRSGARSLQAAQALKAHGFNNLQNMKGGIEAWIASTK